MRKEEEGYNNTDGKVDGRVKYRAPVVLIINHLRMYYGCSTVVLSKSVGCVVNWVISLGEVRYTPPFGNTLYFAF